MQKRLLWPTVLNDKPGFVVMLGRLLHWLGSLAAIAVIILTVGFSLLALVWRWAGGVSPVDGSGVLRAIFYFGVAAILYLTGRGLRRLLSKE